MAARARLRLTRDAALDPACGRIARGRVAGVETLLMVPGTFMNESGRAVCGILHAHPGLAPGDLLVAFDDADLPLGRLRLRGSGGSGGHRGLADVLERLDTRDVPRLRFGIGRPEGAVDTVDWVLAGFEPAERPTVEAALERAACAVECFVAEGIQAAMNRFNPEPAA